MKIKRIRYSRKSILRLISILLLTLMVIPSTAVEADAFANLQGVSGGYRNYDIAYSHGGEEYTVTGQVYGESLNIWQMANRGTEAGIIYVNAASGTGGDGSSWTNAFTDLQAAIDAANAGDQIWVAEGIYYPTGDTDRSKSFRMKNGVSIYGGFAGTEDAGFDLSERDFEANVTTLSGDIGVENDVADNSYHVVYSEGLDNTAVLDGFNITGGNANSTEYLNCYGGGIYNNGGSPTLTNVSFSGNSAKYHGGGMYSDNSSPTLTNMSFSGNSAGYGGGGMCNWYSSPTLTNVSFSGNRAENYGGGIYNNGRSQTLTNVSFSGNSAGYSGGGMHNDNSSLTLTNVNFSGNSAVNYGGGMLNNGGSPTLINVSFSGNSTNSSGGGMHNLFGSPTLSSVSFSNNSAGYGGGMQNDNSSPNLINVNFCGNSAVNYGGGINNSFGSPTLNSVSFSSNNAGLGGGGMFNDGGSPTLSSVSFISNSAEDDGGGMLNHGGSPTLTNVSFSGNSAGNGGGVYTVGGNPIITNSIFWGNTNGQTICDEYIQIAYSIIQDYSGDDKSNSGDSPMFVDEAKGDLRLQKGSPAIDKGITTAHLTATDLDGNSRIANKLVDMGAYEYQHYYVTYNLKEGNGTVTAEVNGNTLDTGTTVESGTEVTFTATPYTGWKFARWDINGTSFDTISTVVTPRRDTTATAYFENSPTADTIYVKNNASGSGDGSSWANAYTDLQVALEAASTGDRILVAAGIYIPTKDKNGDENPSDLRAKTFRMKNGVSIYGGFAGTEDTGIDLSKRDFKAYKTTLSGDIGVKDYNADNSYHVVFNDGLDSTAVLDGFTITGGNANVTGYPNNSGGGMLSLNSSPTLTNVSFIGNSAEYYGGGMYNDGGSPTLTNVSFSRNSAGNTDWIDNPGSEENYYEYKGGGMYNNGGSPTLTNASFSSNSAGFYGGGMYNDNGSPTLTNVSFSRNYAGEYGGAIYWGYSNGSPIIKNSIFWDNWANSGNASVVSLDNISYSLIQGYYYESDKAIIGDDPKFIDAENDDLRLQKDSPARDKGINAPFDAEGAAYGITTDPDGNPRIANKTVDMGAYEYMSYNVTYSLGAGNGSIKAQAGVDTLGADTGVAPGTKITFTATPASRWKFVRWDINGTSVVTSSTVVTVEKETIVKAYFERNSTADIFYVNDNAVGSGDGSSWTNAYTDLQVALDAATTGDSILVAAGKYIPEKDKYGNWNPRDLRAKTFKMKNGVSIYGGFAGTEDADIDLGERDIEANVTTLSGDIGYENDATDNSYHVVYNDGLDSTAVLDGFVITGGNANVTGYPNNSGGGMLNQNSSPTLTNVSFRGNRAFVGGGMYSNNGSPTLTNVSFRGNDAEYYGGAMYNEGGSSTLTNVSFSGNSTGETGGGMYNNGSSPTLTDVSFSENRASYGGGMYNYYSNPILTNVSFSNNYARDISIYGYGYGGGMCNDSSSPILTNVSFSGNSAVIFGGGMYNYSSNPTLTNVSFSKNSAGTSGGGMYSYDVNSNPIAKNSIFWGNTNGQIVGGNVQITYSILQDYDGDVKSNCKLDPKFVDAVKGDLRLQEGSPAIDAGTEEPFKAGGAAFGITTDLGGSPRIRYETVDIGAYEYNQYNIAYSIGAGNGTVTAEADDNTLDNDSTVYPGTKVTFTGKPASGWKFVRWDINGTSVVASSTVVTVERDTTVKAYFEKISTSGSSGGTPISTYTSAIKTEDKGTTKIILTIGEGTILVNGKQVLMDVEPYINPETSRTMVPVRFIAEMLGAQVKWLPDTRQVRILMGEKEILLTIGSNKARVNGVETEIDSPAVIKDSRTFVPLRFISEILGAIVEWNSDTRQITIIAQQ